jgi:regulator of RNase E activity RraA
MFEVKEFPPQIDPELLAQLAKVEPATVGHFKHWGFMDAQLRPVIPGRRAVGTAVTVRSPGIDGFMVTHSLGLVRPGDFLIVDRCGDRRHAGFGGVLAYSAKNSGVAGVIVDGLVTDFAEIRDADLPFWCLGQTAITHKRLCLAGQINVPVSCGGVVVRPGDAIVADEAGILVLEAEEVQSVVERALEMQEREVTTKARMRAGENISQIAGTAQRLQELAGGS